MKKLLETRLKPEYKALWEISKGRRVDYGVREALREEVRSIRNQAKQNGQDELARKLEKYGNNGRWSEIRLRELSRLIYSDKSPERIDIGQWISAEIECILPNQKALNDFILFVRKNGLTKFVTLKDDGSIHPENEDIDCECEGRFDEDGNEVDGFECECGSRHFGKEIVITFKYGNWDFVKGICQKLNSVGARVNKTCGLHVHFDCRHLSSRQVTTLGKRVAQTVPALKQILPKSRSQNQFCQTDINSHRPSRANRREARYAFVNLMSYSKHGTLEIRGHSGTTDPNKIINWIRILRTIMDKRSTKTVNSVSEMLSTFKFEVEVMQYITARYAKFSAQHVKLPNEIDDVSHDNEPTGDQLTLDMATQHALDAIRYIVTEVPTPPSPNNDSAVA